MKSAVSLLLLISLISIPVFGFLTMKHYLGHGNCLATFANGGRCPAAENKGPLSSASSHLNVLKGFSQGVSILFALLLSALIIRFGNLNPIFNDFLRFSQRPALFNFSKARKLRWLSFCEHSPSSI